MIWWVEARGGENLKKKRVINGAKCAERSRKDPQTPLDLAIQEPAVKLSSAIFWEP